MRYFPHILRTVRMGRTRVLHIRPVLYDARNLPAPIISVIIGLPLPVFATACILLPAAPAAPAALPLCLLQPASLPPAACLPPATCPPLCPPFCLLCLLCRSSLPAKKARLSNVSLFYYPVWAFVSPPPTFCASVQKTFPDELLADLGPIGHGMFLSVDEPQRTSQIAVVDVKVCMNLR